MSANVGEAGDRTYKCVTRFRADGGENGTSWRAVSGKLELEGRRQGMPVSGSSKSQVDQVAALSSEVVRNDDDSR
ncbi:hypothetical protein CCHR01_17079 [Colletotrichum chrysophilum]|uniref:Uncharacterized protein n=1 Tax=Colletotrichum chrysophilum TaxID=1836956 RepID=A0AAD9E9G3_9PEZI|nr:hypothetical protein CCHR01_17079 [Colletotrichum chrysophilum]